MVLEWLASFSVGCQHFSKISLKDMTLDQSKVRRRQIEKFLSGNPWKLSARCHFCVFVALVTSQQSHIYANTENPCLNSLYNVLDARLKNLIFFISTDGRSDDTNQTFLRRSPNWKFVKNLQNLQLPICGCKGKDAA